MKTPTPLILLSLVAAITSSPATRAEEPEYKKMPWHLVDLWWKWDASSAVPFERYDIDVSLSSDVADDVRLYVAPIGLGHLNDTPFYGGIQTRSDGNSQADPKLREIGRGLLMSMWGERRLEAIRPAQGGLFQSSGHEGDFVSIRRPYPWTAGKYTYSLIKMDTERRNDQDYTWVAALLYSHQRDENIFIGALRFPGKTLELKNSIASFVVFYGPRRPVEEIPELVVTFGNLRLNHLPVPLISCDAIYPQGVPDYAEARNENGTITIQVGKPIENRTQRQVRLIEQQKPSDTGQ
ncbi:MAG: hypothetical protein R3C12_10775 [Planctomycetaceae bacterium]